MIIDIILIAVILLFAAIGVKRGIAKTLLNLAGLIVTAFLAYYISSFLSQLIYDLFIKQTVITNIQQIIQQNGIDYAVSNSLEAVPEWITGIISFFLGIFGISLNALENQIAIPDNLSASAAQTIESAVRPVVTSLFAIIIIAVLFIIIFIFVKKLIKLVSRVFNIPVIKQINQLFGGILGIAEGFLIVWIAVNIFSMAMQFSNSDLASNELFSGAVFRFFCMGV